MLLMNFLDIFIDFWLHMRRGQLTLLKEGYMNPVVGQQSFPRCCWGLSQTTERKIFMRFRGPFWNVIWSQTWFRIADSRRNSIANRCDFVAVTVPGFMHSKWCHDERDGVSNHWGLDCLLNRLFRRRSKKTSKLHVTGLCEGNSPVTGEFPAQRANNGENVFVWWRYHGTRVSAGTGMTNLGHSM